MESFAISFMTLYGPMSFGWIGFGWLLYANRAQQSRYEKILVHIIEDNTKAMTELNVRLKARLD